MTGFAHLTPLNLHYLKGFILMPPFIETNSGVRTSYTQQAHEQSCCYLDFGGLR